MRHPTSYLLYLLIFLSCGNKPRNHGEKQLNSNIDSLFVQWNKATMLSLNKRLGISKDSNESKLYKNRIDAFKSFMRIRNEDDLNVQSIRYKFLQSLNNHQDKQAFFIVEADRSGERVEIRNFVIPSRSRTNNETIDRYDYYDGRWARDEKYEKISVLAVSNLDDYFVEYGLGFNHDDVIITKIENNKVVESQYYLPTVLSNSIGLKEILE